MKVTAETITDEEIRELRTEQLNAYRVWAAGDRSAPLSFDTADLDHSFVALKPDKDGGRLGLFSGQYIYRDEARARCAEILNARRSK